MSGQIMNGILCLHSGIKIKTLFSVFLSFFQWDSFSIHTKYVVNTCLNVIEKACEVKNKNSGGSVLECYRRDKEKLCHKSLVLSKEDIFQIKDTSRGFIVRERTFFSMWV